eukprot:3584461-Lingulodinium_polyedra.AAC.1
MLDPGQQVPADSATARLERRLCSSIDVDWDFVTSSELLWLSTPAHSCYPSSSEPVQAPTLGGPYIRIGERK